MWTLWVTIIIIIVVIVIALFILLSHKQGLNQPCIENKNCEDGLLCDKNLCKIPVGGKCDTSNDCESKADLCDPTSKTCKILYYNTYGNDCPCKYGLVCMSDTCKIAGGFSCTLDEECATGKCLEGKCAIVKSLHQNCDNSVCGPGLQCTDNHLLRYSGSTFILESSLRNLTGILDVFDYYNTSMDKYIPIISSINGLYKYESGLLSQLQYFATNLIKSGILVNNNTYVVLDDGNLYLFTISDTLEIELSQVTLIFGKPPPSNISFVSSGTNDIIHFYIGDGSVITFTSSSSTVDMGIKYLDEEIQGEEIVKGTLFTNNNLTYLWQGLTEIYFQEVITMSLFSGYLFYIDNSNKIIRTNIMNRSIIRGKGTMLRKTRDSLWLLSSSYCH